MTALSPCAQCHEACCRDYLVTVSGLDAYRISTGLGLHPGQFIVPTSYGDPPDGFRVDTTGRTNRLSLDKRRDGPAAGWCTFWMPVGDGLGRCGIYALRPGVCRTYPATLVDGEVALRTDILCPDGSWGEGSGLFTAQWRSRTEHQYAELEIDAYVNRRWNESAVLTPVAEDGYRRYLDWIFAVYRNLSASGVTTDTTVPSRAVLAQVLRLLAEMTPAEESDAGADGVSGETC
jgi:Fe-S-cluster containining protein